MNQLFYTDVQDSAGIWRLAIQQHKTVVVINSLFYLEKNKDRHPQRKFATTVLHAIDISVALLACVWGDSYWGRQRVFGD